MTTIDWTSAATAATTDYNDALQKAAAAVILGIDDFVADPSAGRTAKLAVIKQLGAVLSNREALIAFLNGQAAPKAAKALGSGDPDADLGDQLDAATAANVVLKSNQQILLATVSKIFGATIGLTDGRVPRTLSADVDTKLDEIRHAAASGAGVIPKATVKAKLDEAIRLAGGLSTTTLSNTVTGKDALIAKLGEIAPLVS